jgi:hypothetical protein
LSTSSTGSAASTLPSSSVTSTQRSSIGVWLFDQLQRQVTRRGVGLVELLTQIIDQALESEQLTSPRRYRHTLIQRIAMSIATALRKTSRKIEFAVTGAEPGTDLLDTLKEEHEEVAELLTRLVKSEKSAERKSLLKQIKAALVPHVRAEEKVLYDASLAQKEKQVKQNGEEGYLEHNLADKMLATLGKISNAMSPEFGAASKVLKELIEHHVAEEERAVWSDARAHFSKDDRIAMNARYLTLKKAVKIPS